MVEVRNTEREVKHLRMRLVAAMGLVIVCFATLAGRFFYLQIRHHADFHALAEENRIALMPAPPVRGIVYDRNGIVLAENESAYTLEIAPQRVRSMDATIDALSEMVEISRRDRLRFNRLLQDWKNFDTVPIKSRLTDAEVARIAARRFMLPGVEIRARHFRTYPLGDTAAHVLGYIGRVSKRDLQRIDDSDETTNYAGTTHIGKIGIELSYERELHGRAGADQVEVSAGGRVVRRLSHSPPVPGSNLVLSIDIRLQTLIEDWFGDRRGALVAIEPATGDVLAFVSKPSYDPNLFVDGIDVPSWQALNDDPDRPLLNRPLRGTYPPGSTYKPFMALAALQSGTRTPDFTIYDPGFFKLGRHKFRDSQRWGRGYVDMRKSIVDSSDTYYYKVAYEMGVDAIHDFMKPWKFGQLTGIDLHNEATGVLPSSHWKMRRYKKHWIPGETPSVGIGQGYNAFTILQLAHATSTLANGGVVMRPHLVQAIEDPITHNRTPTTTSASDRIAVDRAHIDFVRAAMVEVNRKGTGRTAFKGVSYEVAGKTGTAQVVGIKQGESYDKDKVTERHRDHSLFIAFAPADKPRIAIALIIENSGFGSEAAAPMARKVLDYYLLNKLPEDQEPIEIPAPPDSELFGGFAFPEAPSGSEPKAQPVDATGARAGKQRPRASVPAPAGRGG